MQIVLFVALLSINSLTPCLKIKIEKEKKCLIVIMTFHRTVIFLYLFTAQRLHFVSRIEYAISHHFKHCKQHCPFKYALLFFLICFGLKKKKISIQLRDWNNIGTHFSRDLFLDVFHVSKFFYSSRARNRK